MAQRIYILLLSIYMIQSKNPYRILGSAPYDSMKEVKDNYLKKIKNLSQEIISSSNIVSSEYEIKKAWKEIKALRKDENATSNGLIIALKRTLKNIGITIGGLFFMYLFSMFLFKFFSKVFRYSVVLITIFFFTDNFLSHCFETEESQIIFTFFSATLLYLMKFFLRKNSKSKTD